MSSDLAESILGQDSRLLISHTTSSASVAESDPDKTVKKQIEKYEDSESAENADKINSDLYDIQNAMTESFDLLLDREKNIGGKFGLKIEIYERASKLKDGSKGVDLV